MSRPGHRLRALASRVCSARALERLIDPLIADLQTEHAQALRDGRVWRTRWIRVAGTLAFWKVIGLHAMARAVPIAREWAAADRHALGRTAAFTIIASIVATIPLVLLPFSHLYAAMSGEQYARLVAYLLPQALVIGVPVGVACGALFGLRDGRATTRTRRSVLAITVVCSAIALVLLAWVLPESNQAFRELVSGRPVIVRGTNELTLAELWRRGKTFDVHMRLALSCSPVILGLFAFSVAATAQKGRRVIVAGLAAIAAYYSCFWMLPAPIPALATWLPAVLAPWIPNLIFAVTTAKILRSSTP